MTDPATALAHHLAEGANQNGAPHLAEVPSPASTWTPLDLADVLAGRHAAAKPDMLARADGLPLLYRGKLHLVSGEPESGKGWLALHASAERLHAGERVLYLDFEDEPASIVARLVALGVPGDTILDRFRYVRPDEPLDDRGRAALDEELNRLVALAVVDGVTEALTVHGFRLEDNGEVAKWLNALPRRLSRRGAAVVLIDHVVKDREARGRYAIGAQHKLAGVDVAYSIKVLEPFGRGRTGRSRLTITKDRPGHLRQHADQGGHLAHLQLVSRQDGSVQAQLIAPDGDATGAAFRPTVLMERVSRAVESDPGLTARAIKTTVKGAHNARDLALELLLSEGYLTVEPDGRALRHHSQKPYREADDPACAHVPTTCPDCAPGTSPAACAHVPSPYGARGTRHTPNGTPANAERAQLNGLGHYAQELDG